VTRLRLGLLLALLCAALACSVLLALLASDALAWKARVERQDAAYLAGDSSPRWAIDPSFPFGDPAGDLLAVADDVGYRRALVGYRDRNAGPTFDNGVTRRENDAAAEIALAHVEQFDPDPLRASRAANLLGILAIDDPAPIAPGQPEPADRALTEFQNAVRLDPANATAKANLELLLRQLVARGQRQGANAGQAGRGRGGRRGAGVSPPGRGY
jgi:hypothetical protein